MSVLQLTSVSTESAGDVIHDVVVSDHSQPSVLLQMPPFVLGYFFYALKDNLLVQRNVNNSLLRYMLTLHKKHFLFHLNSIINEAVYVYGTLDVGGHKSHFTCSTKARLTLGFSPSLNKLQLQRN